MTPLGNHIQIFNISPINKSQFITEKESLQKARVAEISPDIKVPFQRFDTIFFYTGKEINLEQAIFLNLDMIVGYE